MSIPVRISGTVHYVARWRAAWAALTGSPARTLCGQVLVRQGNPPGEYCRACAHRAGEPSL